MAITKNLPAADIEVWIAGVDRSSDVVLHNVAAFTGNRPETARFELWNIGNNPIVSIFENTDLSFNNSEVNIKIGSNWAHFGKIVSTESNRSPDGESRVYASRFDQHLFGFPLYKAPIAADADLSQILSVDGADIVLNPLYEGVIVDNRVRTADSGGLGHPTLLCSEQAYQLNVTPSVSPWSMSYAVWFLCDWLNPDEDYINNPTFSELELVFPFDESEIQNVRLKLGSYLPELLDSLLNPLGYGWKVTHLSKTSRKIEVYQRGSSTKYTIKQQASGTNYGFDYFVEGDNALAFNVKNDIVSNAVSDVLVIGGRQQVETTIELTPDWDSSFEDRDQGYYQQEAGYWEAEPELSYVFRRWMVVPSDSLLVSRSLLDSLAWNTLIGFNDPFFTRRKFLPCVTKRLDGRPFGKFSGCHIEYAIQGSGELQWHPVEGSPDTQALKDGTTIEMLDDELGIYFNGKMPPMKAQQVGIDNFRLRITSSVESDARHIYNLTDPASQIDDYKAVVVDMENSFPFRKLAASVLVGRSDALYDGITDSTQSMQNFATTVLSRQRFPETSGTITIPTIDFSGRDYLGKSFQKFEGMEIDFYNGLSYPTTSGWSVDVANQITTLTLGGN